MVRVFLKGGVWKNSEDEILKAAVQKYGKQQWARVASLLNRKSAKQCKARWHEWLDPSVRKVEWSREEEEKLLHLAKLMPAQWKTIGPLVGRTATQCQEHYEKLLDEAASGGKEGEEGGDAEGLRHQPLRVGQIDSHPETKPARPDPIDMDEDEIEMLQEARARLANTQGKKAKRKAREKMLAQAKRLAELQKRRELKQAGLLSSQAKKKSRRSRDIDLGVEIPFHKPAPAGFHDVSSEVARSESARAKQMKSVDFKRLNEQQYRSRDREAAQAKKREEARLRALERSNMQYVVAEVSKNNDPLNIRKRGALNLPEPSVTDQELKQLAKIESAAAASSSSAEALGMDGNDATKTLLADYSDRPLPTPMRTPMSASTSGGGTASALTKQQNIMREASNLRMLERGQTPLLGGDNPMLQEAPNDDTGEGDAGEGEGGRPTTPGGPLRPQTPHRDHFNLNRPQSSLRGGGSHMDDTASVGASTFATSTNAMSIRDMAREERRAAKRARRELEAALAALPAPQFEYELEVPEAITEDDDDDRMKVETVMDEDAADIEAAQQRRLQEEADRLYRARSSVMKRKELPRPFGAIPGDAKLSADMEVDDNNDSNDHNSKYIRLIDEERWKLLRHDAHAFPAEPNSFLPMSEDGNNNNTTKGGTKKKKKNKKDKKSKGSASEQAAQLPTPPPPPETPLDYIPEQVLDDARDMIRREMELLMEEKSRQVSNSDDNNGPAAVGGRSLHDAKQLLLDVTIKESLKYGQDRKKNEHDVFVMNDNNNSVGQQVGGGRWKDTSLMVMKTEKTSSSSSSSEKEERQKEKEEITMQSFGIEFDSIIEATSTLRKKNDKVESKLAILTGGLVKRTNMTIQNILSLYTQIQNSSIEQSVYNELKSIEEVGGISRIDTLRRSIYNIQNDDSALQNEYQYWLSKRNELVASLSSSSSQQQQEQHQHQQKSTEETKA